MTRKQGEKFVSADVRFQTGGVVEGLAGEIGIVVFLGERDAFVDVGDAGLELEECLEFLLQAGGLGGDGLRLVGVVPELGGTHGLLERVDFVFEGRDVKDTS